MMASTRRYLVEGIVIADTIYLLMLLRENPRFGYPRSNDGRDLGVVLPYEGIVLEQLLDGGRRWSGVSCDASMRWVWRGRVSTMDV